MNKLLPFILLIAGVLLTTCEERERSNPIDPNADPDAWAPSNLQAEVINDSQIKLTWTQEEERISGFRIGRKEGSGSFSQIAEVEKVVTEYTDTGLSYGTDYTYRVQAFTDANVSQYIEITIYIPQPTLTITSPNGGETWQLGSTHDITWTSTGDIGNVMIKLYKDGYSYLPIVDVPGTENDGSYTWDILSSWAESSTYIIKIYSNIPYEFLDESNNYFSIEESSNPTITVTSPNGGENWETGSNENITWTSSNLPTSCRIFINLFKGGVFDRTIVGSSGYYGSPDDGTSNDGSYTWSIPSSLDESSDYKVIIIAATLVIDAMYGDYWENISSDYSDNYFTIEESSSSSPTITVTSPNGGEEWEPGGSQTITWDSENLSGSSVGISLYRSGSYVSSISSGTGDDGNYSWSISSSQTESDYYQVKIYSTSESSISDYSDNYFTIEESSSGSNPTITVTSPNGGENIERGNTYGITWDSENLSGNYVGIQLYISGSQIANITGYTTDDGYYTWSIHTGQTESNMYQIKIYDYDDDSVYDLSDNYFTISSSGGGGCVGDEIEDCYGNCCPASWVGDGYCDDGQYSYNGIPIYLNCAALNYDNGDCDGGGGGSNADCDDPHYCSDCDGCEGSCCPNYCSGNYYYYNRSCSNGFCVGATSDYCPNGCDDDGCL